MGRIYDIPNKKLKLYGRRMKYNNERKPIAYLVDPFPASIGTFVLSEMEGLEEKGIPTIVFSKERKEAAITHEIAKKWLSTAVIAGYPLSLKVIFANMCFLFISPLKYINAFFCNKWYGGKQQFLRAFYFAWMVKKKKIQHIHAHFAWNADGALLISKFTGISFSCTMHASDILYSSPISMTEIINKSKFTVMISDFNWKYIINRWPGVDVKKLKLVRCGINLERFVGSPLRRKHQKINLLTVARLAPIKQIPFHLEICKTLYDNGFSFMWRFTGDGEERPSLETLIKKYKLENCTELVGLVPYEKMIEEYLNADIFVLLSKTEGVANVLMEAMATGLPVVASRTTGQPELVKDEINGYLISGRDLNSATKAITKLMESEELRRKMGKQGQKKVSKEYTQKKNATEMMNLFDSD